MCAKNFTQYFEIIYKNFKLKAASLGTKATNRGFCELLSVTRGKLQKWKLGQWPSAEDIAAIHDNLGFSYEWLLTGEGDMFTSSAPSVSAESSTPAEQELRRENKELRDERDRLRDKVERLQDEVSALKDALMRAMQQQIETANTGEIPVRSGKPAHTSPDGMSSK